MDPYSHFSREKEHYEYTENQRENYTDLTDHGNDSVKMFADVLFSKPIDDLPKDSTGILFDESMEMIDVHGALTELFLMGFDWLGNNKTLFDLVVSYDDIIFDLNKYFDTIGVKIVVMKFSILWKMLICTAIGMIIFVKLRGSHLHFCNQRDFMLMITALLLILILII